MDSTGAATPQLAAATFIRNGVPASAIMEGGKITGIRVERIWVRAWIDPHPYLGAADWDKGRAMSIAEDFLVKFEDKINAIYCGDDGMAAGAVQALKDADMGSGKVTVIGIGLNKQGIANIKDREQFGSAAHEPADFAKYCFSTVDKILKGQKVPKKVMVPGPWYDATNIDSYPYGEGTW